MSEFKYKFESILRIKNILEKKVLKEIAEINFEINKAEELKKNLIKKLKDLNETASKGKIKALEYKSVKAHCNLIEKEIEEAERKILDLMNKKKMKQEELKERTKERRILEKLKEKKYEEYIVESNRTELKQLDEIAINNFNRK
ncbi:flagellar export protein FliJ [Melioribacter roseus P3M-2]|uniref:Flagellar FliJ protein n=1 Tax=Melioribacter roseus (strain DSM 23840 / JCM 17771 / VKM B-2668 / P3M-2) TaxID=1191523 RepID=I7A2C4_MELRP|nr:flagellar FliJ family protein [Melioribacter roseus]AFN75363.1 flagellar export protein FliJ [Melioribacter roseus P3M-2]